MEGKKRDKIHKNASMEEVKKAQYNHNCHVQGFLGVALKTLSPPLPLDLLPYTFPLLKNLTFSRENDGKEKKKRGARFIGRNLE